MQSSAIVSSSRISRRSDRLSRFCSFLVPVHRYYLSQDGETVSRGSVRYGFVGFCDNGELSELVGQDVTVGHCIGYIRDAENYRICLLHTESDSYILLKGQYENEVFRQIK